MPLCLDVLRQVANNEQDYIRIIVQLIQDLRESEPPVRMSMVWQGHRLTCPRKGLDEDEIAARCLKMCMHSLERVTSVGFSQFHFEVKVADPVW